MKLCVSRKAECRRSNIELFTVYEQQGVLVGNAGVLKIIPHLQIRFCFFKKAADEAGPYHVARSPL